MSRKITFIGAGSTVFAKNLMGDIWGFPELADSKLTLFDIDPERLKTSEIVAHKIAQALGISDVLAVLYFHALRYQPQNPEWEQRDRFAGQVEALFQVRGDQGPADPQAGREDLGE